MKNCQVSSFTETILLTLKIICKVLQINIVVIIVLKWLSQGLYIVFHLRFSVNSLSDLLPPDKSDIVENRTTCTRYRSNLLWQVYRQIITSFWLHCLTSGWVGTIFFRWHVTGLKFEDRIPSSDCLSISWTTITTDIKIMKAQLRKWLMLVSTFAAAGWAMKMRCGDMTTNLKRNVTHQSTDYIKWQVLKTCKRTGYK